MHSFPQLSVVKLILFSSVWLWELINLKALVVRPSFKLVSPETIAEIDSSFDFYEFS